MSGVLDSDIELLEASLDKALTPEESAALDARLAREPEMAAALEALRSERSQRQAMFASLEPDDRAAEVFADRLCAAAFGSPRIAAHAGPWRWVSAVAACLLVGFLTGWAGRSHLQNSQPPLALRDAKPTVHTVYQVSLTDEKTGRVAVQTFDSLEKAQQFARDTRDWQEHRQSLQNGLASVAVAKF